MPEQIGTGKFCSECKRERYYAKGLCATCYMQQRRAAAGLPQHRRPVLEPVTDQDKRATRRAIEQRYRERHPEKLKEKEARRTARRSQNPEYREQARQATRRWREENPKRASESRIRYYRANREKLRQLNNAWRKAHPDQVRANNTKREAMERGAKVHETVRRETVYRLCQGICHICLKPVDPNKYELEHVIPLRFGGSHSYQNVAIAHPRCNRSKGAKLHTKSGQLRLL